MAARAVTVAVKQRVIVYTGKGGVGKTSVAAATAVLCAERGQRTLVISTDVAHSLGDAFGKRIGPEPTRLAPRLWAQETDVFHTIGASWKAIQEYFAEVFRWRGLDDVIAQEMTVLPGLDEIASLLEIVDHFESGRYDVIVVDAAPTGETIRLLSLPEAARWWLDRVLPIQRKATYLAGPMLRKMTGVPVPDDAVYRAGEDLFHKLDRMHRLLSDGTTTSMRLVLTLEKMVIAEALRSFTYFHLFGYVTDLVICNRVMPKDSGGYFAAWHALQGRYLPTVIESFAPVPVRRAPFFGHEVVGMEPLRELAAAIFDDTDPARFYYHGRPYRVERENGGYALSIELPNASRGEVGVQHSRDELVVQVGSWRRNLVLPRVLAGVEPRDARLKGGLLQVYFESPKKERRRA